MKKRVKLLTTIASLCLAVALMAFGVYAATQVNMNVTSSVTFTSNEVYVIINGYAYADANGVVAAEDTKGTVHTYQSYDASSNDPKDPGEVANDNWANADVALSDTNLYAVYTFEITNNGSKDVTVTITDTESTFGDNLAKQDELCTLTATAKAGETGNTAVVTYVAKVLDARTPIESGATIKLVVNVK